MKSELVKAETLKVGEFFKYDDVVYLKVELPKFHFMYTKGVTIEGKVKKIDDDDFVEKSTLEKFIGQY